MKTGFLSLITHPQHPDLVRVRIDDEMPELKPQADGSAIRYLARFMDSEAGLMHIQNAMHSTLVDLENRIYRQPLTKMIACVEAEGLDHERIWIDPEIPAGERSLIDTLIKRRKASQRRIDRIWQAVGILGLLLLLLTSLKL
jgi:hypothetical protein